MNELEGVVIMARMTNAEIVAFAWGQLVGSGVISSEEEIHTFQKWKSLGCAVKRGEKAVIKLSIWKHTTKQITLENGENVEDTSMFMKTAAFFSTSQVEKIQPVKKVSAAEMVGKKVTITIGK